MFVISGCSSEVTLTINDNIVNEKVVIDVSEDNNYYASLDGIVYSKDMTYEEKLGGLFNIVGHEITHGFDSNGSQYDKDGYNNPILSDDDLEKFNDKTGLVGAYYTSQSPFTGAGMILGPQVAAEATAEEATEDAQG